MSDKEIFTEMKWGTPLVKSFDNRSEEEKELDDSMMFHSWGFHEQYGGHTTCVDGKGIDA